LRIISKKALRDFWDKHPEAKGPLEQWYKVASRAAWRSLSEVKLTYPHADKVGECTVFNIKGNDYRLVVWIIYSIQRVYIRHVLTHAEYDKEGWKDDCNC
jgi:mRNA interferase HigB